MQNEIDQLIKHDLFPNYFEIWALRDYFYYDHGFICVSKDYLDVIEILIKNKSVLKRIVKKHESAS
jgi:hypothetical protein